MEFYVTDVEKDILHNISYVSPMYTTSATSHAFANNYNHGVLNQPIYIIANYTISLGNFHEHADYILLQSVQYWIKYLPSKILCEHYKENLAIFPHILYY